MAFLARLLGPLLARELLRLARSPMLRLAYMGAPIFLLLLMLGDGNARMMETSRERAAAEAARFVAQTFVLAGGVLALMLPLWICPTIIRERKEGGLDLILTTQLSIREVLLGLAGASAIVSATVIASLAPVLSMMMLFGGVDFYSVLTNTYRLGLEVVCLTGACIYAAASQQSSIRATVLGAFWGLIAFGGFAIVSMPALNTVRTGESSNLSRMVGFLGFTTLFGAFAAALFLGWLQAATKAIANGSDEIVSTRSRHAEKPQFESPDVKRSAMWGPLKIRLDDSSPTRFQIRAVWFLYLAVGMPFCWLVRSGQGTTVSPLLLIIWIAIQPFLIVVAATNPLLGRRPGFFDDLLTTNLPEKEIVAGVLWIVQPALIRLLAAPLGLAVLWFALNPIGHTVGTLIGLAWTAEIVLVGAVLSLADNRLSMRLMGLVAFWSVAGLAPIIAKTVPSPELASLPFAAAIFAFLAWLSQRKLTWPRTLFFCLCLHAACSCIGGWIGSHCAHKLPSDTLELATPLPWLSLCFWTVQTDSFRFQSNPNAALAALPFALSLLASATVFKLWTEKKFNQLVGRTGR